MVNAGRNPVVGLDRAARFFAGLVSLRARDTRDITIEPVLVNGDAGVVFRGNHHDGRRLAAVLAVAVADGRITAVYNQINPAKLGSLDDR